MSRELAQDSGSSVRSVEAIPVAYPEPNDFDAIRHLCLVKIVGEDGSVGWGESITQFREASFATKAIVDGMSDRVIGRSPMANRAIWTELKDHSWWYGYAGGIASNAIAAIDIALWDLKGQALGVGVCDLLGGPVHERLPVIASAHAHHESIEAMADEAAGWLDSGLQGMKVGFRQARKRQPGVRIRPRCGLRQKNERDRRSRSDANDRSGDQGPLGCPHRSTEGARLRGLRHRLD